MSFIDFQMQIKKDGTRGEISNLQLDIDDMHGEVNKLSMEIKRRYALTPTGEEYRYIQDLKEDRSALFERIEEAKELKRNLNEFLHSL